MGRWLNRDPIEETGGLNLYVFSLNNSNFYFDKLGKQAGPIGPTDPRFERQCCVNGKIYTTSDRIDSGVFICREQGWDGHEYMVVNGLRIDFSAVDRDLTGILWGEAIVEIDQWIPVPSDSCYEIRFSPCLYGSDDAGNYASDTLDNARALKANPGYYNVIFRSCRDLDRLILPY